MKKLLLFIIAIFMITSCSKDSIESAGIIGKWKSESSTGYPRFVFKSENTYTVLSNEDKSSSGTYRISGSNLFLKLGEEFKFTFSVSGDKLNFNKQEVFGEPFLGNYNLIREN